MNFSAIVRHYVMHHRKRKAGELDWFRNQPTLEAAVEKAALAVDERGKRLSHQRRIKAHAIKTAKTALLVAVSDIRNCPNFETLHGLVKETVGGIEGIGPLYVYDVSERIGAKLGLRPEKVYLHTGAADGAEALGFDRGLETIEVTDLPLALQSLSPDEIEDVLCMYKDDFENGRLSQRTKRCT
jgi:hypothetical protein